MDETAFVEQLTAAVPEAFPDRSAAFDLDGEPLSYAALGDARIWLEQHALRTSILGRKATVRAEHEDVFRRFWAFVERQAEAGRGDTDLETLIQLECFEGVVWIDDVLDYLGPATRALMT